MRGNFKQHIDRTLIDVARHLQMVVQFSRFESQAIDQRPGAVLEQRTGALERAAVESGSHVVEFHATDNKRVQGDGSQARVQFGEACPSLGW